MKENKPLGVATIVILCVLCAIFLGLGCFALGITLERNGAFAHESKAEYLLHTNYTDYMFDDNKLYEVSDTDAGDVTIYYRNGNWVTLRNHAMYSLQQYLLPKSRTESLENEVADIPGFDPNTVTYMGIDYESGDVFNFEGTTSFSEVQNTYGAGNIVVFVEWSVMDGDKPYYYSYEMRYGDVSILHVYSEEINLFRGLLAYVGTETLMTDTGTTTETTVTDTSATADTGTATDTSVTSDTAESTTTTTSATEVSSITTTKVTS